MDGSGSAGFTTLFIPCGPLDRCHLLQLPSVVKSRKYRRSSAAPSSCSGSWGRSSKPLAEYGVMPHGQYSEEFGFITQIKSPPV